MPAVTIRLTGELRPGRGDGRRGAGSGFGRQRPSTPTVVSGWERLAAVRLRSAATAAPAVADAPSAPESPTVVDSSLGLPRDPGRAAADRVDAGLDPPDTTVVKYTQSAIVEGDGPHGPAWKEPAPVGFFLFR